MFDHIRDAAARLAGQARRTPVVSSGALDRRVGARVLLKCENFQRTGAFKFRGAFNTISRLGEEERRRGVLSYSSGNHAQAVALVGRLLGVNTTIVMPRDAPRVKLEATRGYGADVILYDPLESKREELARRLQEEGGFTLVPPFDHPHIVAGQGTAALELGEEAGPLDLLIVPCGGGGLLSGSAVAIKGLHPACRVVGIEPVGADDANRSFRTGTLQRVERPQTLADGVRTPSLGEVTFPLILQYVDDMATVSEEAIREAVRFLFHRTKLVVEPSGALGVAALLEGSVQAAGRVGVILSGGNVDGEMMAEILRE